MKNMLCSESTTVVGIIFSSFHSMKIIPVFVKMVEFGTLRYEEGRAFIQRQ